MNSTARYPPKRHRSKGVEIKISDDYGYTRVVNLEKWLARYPRSPVLSMEKKQRYEDEAAYYTQYNMALSDEKNACLHLLFDCDTLISS